MTTTAHNPGPTLADGTPYRPGMTLWRVITPTLADGAKAPPILERVETQEDSEPERYGRYYILKGVTIGQCGPTPDAAIGAVVAELEAEIDELRRRIERVRALGEGSIA